MLIFATDSTATVASVAVCLDDRPLACYTVQNGNTHSETLLPMAQTVLDALSLRVEDIDLFACTAGPGSFTGVRIGAATIKGLAFAGGKPCIGVSSLESLAYQLTGLRGILCPVINARKFLYYALFACTNGSLTRLCEDSIVPLEEWESAVCTTLSSLPQELQGAPLYMSGDGYDVALRAMGSLRDRCQPTPMHLRDQNACCIAQLARERYLLDPNADWSDRALSPVYLRPCQAERELTERLNAQKIKTNN